MGCLACDQTCNSCSGPYLTNCLSCKSGAYLYWNSTCQNSCPSPFKSLTSQANSLSCSYPCCAAEYLLPDDSCNSNCDSCLRSFTQDNHQFCLFPGPLETYSDLTDQCLVNFCQAVPANSYFLDDTITKAFCNKVSVPASVLVATRAAETISSIGLMLTIFTSRSGSVTVSSRALAKALQYSRFIDVISYTSSLQVLFKETPPTVGFLPFNPKIPAAFEYRFQAHQLPYKFRLYSLHSSYIVNFWKDLMSLAIAFAITISLALLEYLSLRFYKQQKIYVIIKKSRSSFLSFSLLQLDLI